MVMACFACNQRLATPTRPQSCAAERPQIAVLDRVDFLLKSLWMTPNSASQLIRLRGAIDRVPILSALIKAYTPHSESKLSCFKGFGAL